MTRAVDSSTTASAAGAVRLATARCPQCFSSKSSLVDRFRSPLVSHDAPWQVVRCKACEQMYTNPRPPIDDWGMYYPDTYPAYRPREKRKRWRDRIGRRLDDWLLYLYRGYGQQGGKPTPGRPNRRRLATLLDPILSAWLDPYILPLHGDGVLLDVGCGSGEYLAKMRGLGWETLGLDRSPTAADVARSRFEIPVVVGTLPSDEFPRETFDLITAWQVLEHLDRPRQALACVRELLRPTGRFVLTVPNQAGWGAHFFGPAWIGLDLPRHLTHFTAQSLASMLNAEGFRVVFQSTLGQSGWLRHSARQSAHLRHSLSRRSLALKLLSRSVSAWATRRNMGESLYVVARRA